MHSRVASGFSLVEMSVTLLIIAISFSLAAPSLSGVIQRSNQRHLAQALVGAIELAKSEAAKRNSRVNLCISSDQKNCTGGGWEQGWLMYQDTNSSRSLDVGSEPVLLYENGPFPRATARGNRPLASYISFMGNGRPQLLGGGLQMGSITVCAPEQTAIRVVLAHSGRVRTELTTIPCP